eukprot:3018353-Rhodomonas_salina.2
MHARSSSQRRCACTLRQNSVSEAARHSITSVPFPALKTPREYLRTMLLRGYAGSRGAEDISVISPSYLRDISVLSRDISVISPSHHPCASDCRARVLHLPQKLPPYPARQ